MYEDHGEGDGWSRGSGLRRRQARGPSVVLAHGDRSSLRAWVPEDTSGIVATTDVAELTLLLDTRPDASFVLDGGMARAARLPIPSRADAYVVGAASEGRGVRTCPSADVASRVAQLALRARLYDDLADHTFLGVSLAAEMVRAEMRRVARFPDISVLLLGATGTGKERVAETIHRLTCGDDAPFVAINCAALPDQLVESELFGHEVGAFTGARQARVGLMEAAAGGTLFLDEIGEMPSGLQSKLLRALETRSFRPLGSNRSVPLEARVISATNRLPRGDGDSGLRDDLYFRLAGFTMSLSSLRRRALDVPVLARLFLRQFEQRYGLSGFELTDAALDELEHHAWPGNVRELRTVVEHAAVSAAEPHIRAEGVRLAIESRSSLGVVSASHAPRSEPPHPVGLYQMEREMITQALNEHAGNVSRAAARLGIPRSTLRDKLRRYGIV